MRVAVTLALLSLSSACASTQSFSIDGTSGAARRPMVASVGPMAPEPATQPTQSTQDEQAFDDSAGGLLEKAFYHFNRNELDLAASTFGAAIATNNLNDAGRALAYWHIYLSERRLGHEDKSTEALSSFAVVAEDVIEVRNETRYAITPAGDFVDRFNLDTRLSRARAILSATWVKRMPDFGRSAELAVPVFDEAELDYFFEIAPPCNESVERQIDRQMAPHRRDNVQMVTLYCGGNPDGTEYFIEMIDPTQ